MSPPIRVVIDADLAEIVPVFIANRHRDLERISSALRAADWDGLRLLGHSMKGAGGGYGFDAITTIGAALERAALERDGAAIEAGRLALEQFLAEVEVVYQ